MTDMHNNSSNNGMKRSKKLKPLFGIFPRKTTNKPMIIDTSLGSGTIQPLYSETMFSPQIPQKPLFSPQYNKTIPRNNANIKNRSRSKSVGGTEQQRLIEEREFALNKLCSNDKSPIDSIPLLPNKTLRHQASHHTLRKATSAHDLKQKANKQPPVPSVPHLSRSKSAKTCKVKSPISPHPPLPTARAYDDDDIPLGYLTSPTTNSLLSNDEEEDDHDLVPIVQIKNDNTQRFQSAADKYKEKVKQKLQLRHDDKDDDDNLPISYILNKK